VKTAAIKFANFKMNCWRSGFTKWSIKCAKEFAILWEVVSTKRKTQ